MILLARVLSVQTIRDQPIAVELVKDPVCIVLHRCRKNDQLIRLAHLLEKFVRTRSDEKVPTRLRVIKFIFWIVQVNSTTTWHLNEMNQCLV